MRAVIVDGSRPFDKSLHAATPNLGLIACFNTGYEGIDINWARKRGIIVTSLEAGLRKFARTLLAVLLEERHLAFQRLVVAEALRYPKLCLIWYRNGPALISAVLKGFPAEHQGLGHVYQDVDLSQAALLFHDMIVGDLLNRAMMAIEGGPKSREIDMAIHQAVKMATMGLGPNGQGGVP